MATPDQSSFGGNPSTSEQLIAELQARIAEIEGGSAVFVGLDDEIRAARRGGNPSTSEQFIAKLARRVATAENPDN